MYQMHLNLEKIIFITLSFGAIILTACNAVTTPPALTPTLARPTRAASTPTSIALAATLIPTRTPPNTIAPSPTRVVTPEPTLVSGKLPVPTGAPVSSWHDFPILPNPIAGQDNDKGGYFYSVRATPQQIQDFYTREMKKLGWDLLSVSTKANDPGYLFLIYNQANYPTLSVLVSVQGDVAIVFLAN